MADILRFNMDFGERRGFPPTVINHEIEVVPLLALLGKAVTLSTSCGHALTETDRLSNPLVGKLFSVLYPLCTSQLIPVHLPEVGVNAQLTVTFFDCRPPIGSNPQLPTFSQLYKHIPCLLYAAL
jgi:hypothetical protein